MTKWRSLPGWPFEVSDQGEVRRAGTLWTLSSPPSQPYLIVELNDGPRCQKFLVHRLVAQLFIPNPQKLPLVHHANNDKRDARASNLEWVTRTGNVQRALADGRFGNMRKGEAHRNAKLTGAMVLEIRERYQAGESTHALSQEYPVAQQTLHKAAVGLTWKHL